MKHSTQDMEGFATIQCTFDGNPEEWEQEVGGGWTMILAHGKREPGLVHVSFTKDKEAIGCFFDVDIRTSTDGLSGRAENKRTTVHLNPDLESISFTVSTASKLAQLERSDDKEDSHSKHTIDFIWRTRADGAVLTPTIVCPAGLVDAIARATIHGAWGDICFVVLDKDGTRYACVYGDHAMVQAHGTTELMRLIGNNSFPSLEAALSALKRKPALREQETQQSLRRFVPVCDMAVTTLQAIVVYLQTRCIKFSPIKKTSPGQLRSLRTRRDRTSGGEDVVSAEEMDIEGGEASPLEEHLVKASGLIEASPKSVYGAACRFGLIDLEDLAYKAIEDHITASNVLDELLCNFVLENEEIKAKLLRYALANWERVKKEYGKELVGLFMKKIHRVGAQEVVQTIMEHTTIKGAAEQL